MRQADPSSTSRHPAAHQDISNNCVRRCGMRAITAEWLVRRRARSDRRTRSDSRPGDAHGPSIVRRPTPRPGSGPSRRTPRQASGRGTRREASWCCALRAPSHPPVCNGGIVGQTGGRCMIPTLVSTSAIVVKELFLPIGRKRLKVPARVSLLFHRSFLSLAVFWLGGVAACGSDATSSIDGAVEAMQSVDGVAEGGGLDGAGETDCADLPCVVTTANVIAGCKPSSTCTYQMMPTAVSRCFDNGVKISVTYPAASASSPGGQMVMAVKKGGALCYTLDVSYTDTSRTAATFVYQDASGAAMITLFADNKSTTATCPGGSPVPVGTSGSCANAQATLGGLVPASSCIYATAGMCQF
jgi:hypothetical protein